MKTSKLLISSVCTISALVGTSGCSKVSTPIQPELKSLTSVKVGMPTSVFAASPKLFYYAESGHFGDKVQYDSTAQDERGGTFSAHCRGECYLVEVKYPPPGLERQNAVAVMSNIVPDRSPTVIEHDDEDLRLHDCKNPGEFFYFKNGARAELVYAPGEELKVSQISVWNK